ncbi:hypothetical protein [Phytoactinopolyspora endophytica]|uniref:hypothetical protein n=1 Tax=Phytoactinopolyspora endophytica TaxID=1642495 RepID=UPI00101DAA13|nr:hypothetical protein [Phytoactinopolyspora endophytica]
MTDEKPRYNRLVNPEFATGEAFAQQDPAGGRSAAPAPMNPWLVAMGVAGVVAFFLGMVLYVGGIEPGIFETPSAARAAWGNMLALLGVMLMAGVMLAAAVCWQLRRR